MKHQPKLYTTRLVLRPFTLEDAPEVQRMSGAREIASTTLNIPHPYEDGMAEEWIRTHSEGFAEDKAIVFAITHREQNYLMGAMDLRVDMDHERGEIGYWIGKDYWGRGYCTEAAARVLEYGFNDLKLNRIQAYHIKRNPASGRVMRKIGMICEGCQRQDVKKWGEFEDCIIYGILRCEYNGNWVDALSDSTSTIQF
jgi:RimJ/RimL family protein N-acetyltransferase